MKLVTGATGFLGSALTRSLVSAGIRARGVTRARHPESKVSGVEYVTADLRNIRGTSDIFDSVDTIIHLASTTIPSTSMDDMVLDAQSNLEMALRLLEAARTRGIKNFLFASSGGTVYGEPVRLPAQESDPTNPISSYGIVKLAIEKYVGLFSRQHGIRGVSLRITNPYGRGQLSGTPIGVIARLLRHARDGDAFAVWGDGSAVRDYFHVDDLMRSFLEALDPAKVPSGVYNIGSGHGTSMKDLMALVERVTGRSIKVRYEPGRTIDVSKIWVDTEKFRDLTGWQARISLDDGVRKLWHSLLDQQQERT